MDALKICNGFDRSEIEDLLCLYRKNADEFTLAVSRYKEKENEIVECVHALDELRKQIATRHLHIAVLTQGTVRWELSNYLHHLLINEEVRKKRDFSIRYYLGNGLEGRPVSSNRNRVVRDRPRPDGVGSDLLMIDSDVVPSSRLLEASMQGLDIVICPTPIWRPNDGDDCPARINMNTAAPDKVMTLGAETYENLLQGGTGAIYISNEVLGHPDMHAPFAFLVDDDGVGYRGEDYTFCDRARAAGFKIYSANALMCGHIHPINLLSVMRRFYELMEQSAYDDGGLE